ncbi:alpha/beta fold hydrolase [Arenicella xantha]|uniref:Pimeloyl-ACP methyl ester carboxylesterase n=1 Tax=Arenicella xantha TaxID=644221 RepID=A0A395JLW1_9GAMM|nr:alpha/beta hydrolase [Arenicella xantha]RBP51752.1 pimeloyl-ACP methyl ester carboxylesterase [Arenicella xantha]
MNDYADVWYTSADKLSLYARDYGSSPKTNSAPVTTVLCMHGLTRNSADFAPLCSALKVALPGGFRLIAVDQRGRGRSDYDDNPENYTPAVYMHDMFALLEHLDVDSVIAIGTSMGGIIAMLMAAYRPDTVRAMVINDIAPEVPPAAIKRLQRYVGQLAPVKSWDDAIAQTKLINEFAFPNASAADWQAFAERLFVENTQGIPELAYDANIKQAFSTDYDETPPDMWGLFEQIIDIPMLLIRGELSDLLTSQLAEAMRHKKPDLNIALVPQVGHAPMLTEPEAFSAITDFLVGLANPI